MNYINDTADNKTIRQGDTCIIYISEHNRYIIRIEPDVIQQTKFGPIRAMDLLNHPYGVRHECKRGWILPLRLTPEFWTQLLPHRTQILYQADISMILLQLDIKPGSIVVEAGTGSGSLSHAILRACLPNGFLHTFDINESRVAKAQKEFNDHRLGKNVKVTHRNICELGCGDELEGKADACILDLPQTWNAIEHAYKVLKMNGSRLCTFSPCVEQVQQNVAKMNELKFKDIITIECLLRPFTVQEQKLRLWNEDILDGLMNIDKKRFENLKGRLDPSKRAKILGNDDIRGDSSEKVENENKTIDEHLEIDVNSSLSIALRDPKASFTPNMLPTSSNFHAKQFEETVSHSGYLTFASKRA